MGRPHDLPLSDENLFCMWSERYDRNVVLGVESACNAGGTSSIPGLGRSPGGENGNRLQCSCLGNPMDKGAWWATVPGVPKSQIWLSNWACTYTHTHTHTHTHTPVRDEVCWRWRKATWMMECRWPLKDPKGKEMCLCLEPPARSTVQLTPRHSETQDRILNNCQITYLCHFKLLSSQRFVTAEYWKQRRRVIKRDQEVLRSAGSGRVGCVVSGLFGWGQALVGQLSLITRLGLRCAFLSPDALCRQTAERRVGLSDEGAQCRNPTHLSLSTRLLPRGTEKCFSKDKSYLGSWPVIRGA